MKKAIITNKESWSGLTQSSSEPMMRSLGLTMRIAYLECFSGISGDMFLGALLDAGVPSEVFTRTVEALGVDARLEISHVDRSGISATKLDVIAAGEKELPREEFWEQALSAQRSALSHDHEHAHGSGEAHSHSHVHSEGHSHGHSHSHDHDESVRAGSPAVQEHRHEHRSHDHAHSHRGLKEIKQIINA